MGYDGDWPKYVTVAERKRRAAKHVESLRKKGKETNPVVVEGRHIAKSFWGKSWCDNLESYSDFDNRLPRGRTYVRNGSVIDLQVSKGKVTAKVMGSDLYSVIITVKPIPNTHWKALIKECVGKIDSLMDLLRGQFSKAIMEKITQRDKGLFPKPKEISMKCSCPDAAGMCKHIAAVLYGVGATLDEKPWWLFELRHVDQLDLIATVSSGNILQEQSQAGDIDDSDLEGLFGIEMSESAATKKSKTTKTVPKKGSAVKSTAKKSK